MLTVLRYFQAMLFNIKLGRKLLNLEGKEPTAEELWKESQAQGVEPAAYTKWIATRLKGKSKKH